MLRSVCATVLFDGMVPRRPLWPASIALSRTPPRLHMPVAYHSNIRRTIGACSGSGTTTRSVPISRLVCPMCWRRTSYTSYRVLVKRTKHGLITLLNIISVVSFWQRLLARTCNHIGLPKNSLSLPRVLDMPGYRPQGL